MPFSNASFDPETLTIMAEACEAAAAELRQTPGADLPPEQRVARDQLATRSAVRCKLHRDPSEYRLSACPQSNVRQIFILWMRLQ
jgi:hypothetical protein